MVRREALEQVGPLDEQFFIYAEDIDWCKRFWNVGWKVVFFPDAQAIHYRGGSSSNAPIRFAIEQERAQLQYWKKHHTQPYQIGFLLIILFHHSVRIISGALLYFIKPSVRSKVVSQIAKSFICMRSLLSLKPINN